MFLILFLIFLNTDITKSRTWQTRKLELVIISYILKHICMVVVLPYHNISYLSFSHNDIFMPLR